MRPRMRPAIDDCEACAELTTSRPTVIFKRGDLMLGRLQSASRLAAALIAGLTLIGGAATAGPKDEVARLAPMWRQNAPLCDGHPSSQACEDGDMTLFSGLLCAAGEQAGCVAVRAAQDKSGRWHRSPRLAKDPSLKPTNSFSWDMALGVQLYAVVSGDSAAFKRWLDWVETHRPCLSQTPKIDGKSYCLVRGWPRVCTDDTEKGCTVKPQNLATMLRTAQRLGVSPPPPAEDALPGGIAGEIVKKLQAESREANATLSLSRLMPAAKDLQPLVLVIDAAVNREGYPRHLVGVEALLARRSGYASPDVDLAVRVLATKEPENPFFQYLEKGPSDDVATLLLKQASHSAAELPAERRDWAWQRASSEQAWKRSNLWDDVFMAQLLAAP